MKAKNRKQVIPFWKHWLFIVILYAFIGLMGVGAKLNFNINMYTHPYTEYVNHILNKSPSKAAYSFTKAERFRPLNSQQTV